uniref:NADH dehydrogenase subunit 4 n=1 Tax=Cycetogamasus diviortus TaxID=2978624 RepID=UPI0022F2DD88|nr:NADH dehydrogenase subunit 4 [Cycetogamasus diviortus]WAK85129.1 NADH dehydrogenase subunit 4 [Cycetogamasus diviortus]
MLTLVLTGFIMMVLSFFLTTQEVFTLIMLIGGMLGTMFVSYDGFMGVSSMFIFDGMSLFLSFLSVWISALMLLAMANTDAKNSTVFLFFTVMMMCMLLYSFFVYNLIGFYLFFEAVLIPIMMMIFLWGGQPERLQAGLYMLMYTLFGSLPLLLVLLLVNNDTSMDYMYLGYMFNKGGSSLFMNLMLVSAFLIKMPMYSVHLWLPKAHVEAPVAGSMMLAGVLLKLGGYGIYRVYGLMSYLSLCSMNCFLFSLSLTGAVYVGFICLRQVDIKSLIAYSSVCHMGLVIGGVFSGFLWGGMGVMVLMLGHGLCSSALFCSANMMYERFFTRNLMLMKGLMLFFPSMTFWWFVFSVINMGAPPSMNLLGEILLMGSILKWSLFTIFSIGILSFVGACYSLYLFSYSQHGKSWFLYGVSMVDMREYMIMYGHFFPLLLYVFKVEMVSSWM